MDHPTFIAGGLSIWLLTAGVAGAQSAADLPATVQSFGEKFQSVPFDPIQLTTSGRVHAWTAGDGLLAYLFMYEATGSARYLSAFVRDADRVLNLRDSERGLQDFRGLLLPNWRTEYEAVVISLFFQVLAGFGWISVPGVNSVRRPQDNEPPKRFHDPAPIFSGRVAHRKDVACRRPDRRPFTSKLQWRPFNRQLGVLN